MTTEHDEVFLYDEAGGDAGDDGGATEADALPEGAIMSDKWFESLSDDLRGDSALAKLSGQPLEDLARSYVGGQKMLGRDPNTLITVPAEDDADGRRGVFQKLGLPAEREAYSVEAVEGAPEWLGLDQPLGKWFVDAAFENGVMPSAAQALYKGFADQLAAVARDAEEKSDIKHGDQVQLLKEQWGAAFDGRVAQADFAIGHAERAAKLPEGELRKALNEAGLGTHPAVMAALSYFGGLVAEEAGAGGDTGSGRFGQTMAPDEARAKAQDLQRQAIEIGPSNPPEARRLNEEAQQFYKLATGGK